MRWLLAVMVCGVGLGCEPNRPDVLKEYPPPWRADSPAADAKPVRLVGSGGHVLFETTFGKLPIAGKVPITRAWLKLTPADLERTSGEVELDLTQLTLGEVQDAHQEAAYETLEQVQRASRNARFSFWELEAPNVSSLETGKTRKTGGGYETRVTATAHGHLELNGLRTIQRIRLTLSVSHESRNPPAIPEQLSVTSPKRHVLSLSRHEVSSNGVQRKVADPHESTKLSPPTFTPLALSKIAKLSFEAHFGPDPVAHR